MTCVYIAPLATSLRRLKWLSMSSCALTCVGTPYLMFSCPAELPILAKSFLTGILVSFGIGTTALLNVISAPYVTKIDCISSKSPTFRLETYDWLAQPVHRIYPLSDLEPATKSIRPFVNSRSKSEDVQFYIHKEILPREHPLRNAVGL
jgi:hypothetical protein